MCVTGFDALILEGLRGALAKGVVDVVEFEYNSMQYWSPHRADGRTLGGTLAWLHASGYSCFFQGNAGCLVPASASCWRERYGSSHPWSNLVCARGSGPRAPLTVLWELAEKWAPGGPSACTLA